MRTVFFCHAGQDAPVARALAGFLACGAGVRPFLSEGEIGEGEDLLAKAREGLMADAILVLLSPHSAPARWSRDEWIPVFRDEPKSAGVKLAVVQLSGCRIPDLLRRENFFDLSGGALDGFRAVKRWLLGFSAPAGAPPFEPAGANDACVREAELETLRRALADEPGCAWVTGPAGAGKTTLALEFARRAAPEFEGVCWLTCAGRSPAALAGDLAAQLGLRLKGSAEQNAGDLRRFCHARRLLIVIDDAGEGDAARLVAGGLSSALVTSRQRGTSVEGCLLELERCAAADGLEDGHGDRERRLLAAACACAPSGFDLSLAAEIAGLSDQEAAQALAVLMKCSLTRELNRNGPVYAVPSFARERVEPSCREHARVVRRRFGRTAGRLGDSGPGLADLQQAFDWALTMEDAEAWALACDLARSGFALADWHDRLAEAFEFMRRLSAAAEQRQDRATLDICLREQTWILREWGRMDEAGMLEDRRRTQCSDQLWLF